MPNIMLSFKSGLDAWLNLVIIGLVVDVTLVVAILRMI